MTEGTDKAGAASGEGAGNTADATPDARIGELTALITTDPDRYGSEAVQTELKELIGARDAGNAGAAGDGGDGPATGTAVATRDKAQPPAQQTDADSVPADATGYTVPDHPSGEPRPALDEALITGALQEFHSARFTQRQVDAAFKAFDAVEARALVEANRIAAEHGARTREDLQAALGEDWESAISLGNGWLRSELNEALRDVGGTLALMQLRFANGQKVGDHAGMASWLIGMARRAGAGNIAPDTGQGAVPGVRRASPHQTTVEALAARKAEIMALMHTNEDGYKKAQPELQRIITALNSQQQR